MLRRFLVWLAGMFLMLGVELPGRFGAAEPPRPEPPSPPPQEIREPPPLRLSQAALSPDAKLVAAFYPDNVSSAVVIRDAATGKPRHRISVGARDLVRFSWSPDGQVVAIADWRTVTVLDAQTGKPRTDLSRELSAFDAEFGGMMGLAWSGDMRLVAGGREIGQRIRVWDMASGRLLRSIQVGAPRVLALSPDGRRLATDGDWNGVFLWDTATGEKVADLKAEKFGDGITPHLLSWSPDGRRLILGSGYIYLWDVEAQRFLKLPHPSCQATTWSPDSKQIALLYGQHVETFDGTTGRPTSMCPVPDGGNLPEKSPLLAWTAQGLHVLVCSRVNRQLRVLNVSQELRPPPWPGGTPPEGTFLPNGGVPPAPPAISMPPPSAPPPLANPSGPWGAIAGVTVASAVLLAVLIIWLACRRRSPGGPG
jgi:WD40 repeat protein